MEKLEKRLKEIDKEIDRFRIRIKDSEDLKAVEGVFDTFTLKTLYNLANKGYIDALGGVISTGKEANIHHAFGCGQEEQQEREIAIKVYRISTSNFRAMQSYLIGDPRFKNVRHEKRSIVFAWTKKELRNLKKAQSAGVRVPEPFVERNNVLLMEFIGEDEIPAPQLREVSLTPGEARKAFDTTVEYVRKLYHANLVHGDLSEFNILMHGREVVFIDMGQSVTLDHPNAMEFLMRDIHNVTRFFRKKGVRIEEDAVVDAVLGE
ncbi:MAG: serine protein kinase RIO [Euryarchaeota archaeon]|nr:serine protein kinase RIO [Euryarchaeota archaeon]